MNPDTSAPTVTPPSLQGIQLTVSLTVNDLQRSLAWYRDIVGFSVDHEHRKEDRLIAVSLRAGAVQILLGQDNWDKGTYRIKGAGFSLQITTAQDIDELANQIKARGGMLESEPADVFGARTFCLQDPDGVKLAISSPR